MSKMNLDISPWQVVWPRVVLITGLSMIFAPLNVAAYIYTPRSLRAAAVGLLALLRNEGGSVGTTLAQTFQERREQFHLLRLNEFLDPLNPALNANLQQAQQTFLNVSGDPAGSQLMALQSIDAVRQSQASSLAYFDCFWIFAVVGGLLAFLVLLMKRSVAEKGAHAAAE
jgi:DHA2 family multidrug resistance protein